MEKVHLIHHEVLFFIPRLGIINLSDWSVDKNTCANAQTLVYLSNFKPVTLAALDTDVTGVIEQCNY